MVGNVRQVFFFQRFGISVVLHQRKQFGRGDEEREIGIGGDERLRIVVGRAGFGGDVPPPRRARRVKQQRQKPVVLLVDAHLRQIHHLTPRPALRPFPQPRQHVVRRRNRARPAALLRDDDGGVDDGVEGVRVAADHLVDAAAHELLAQRAVRLDGHERVRDDVGQDAIRLERRGAAAIAQKPRDERAVRVFGT